MARKSDGPGIFEIALIAVGGYLLYRSFAGSVAAPTPTSTATSSTSATGSTAAQTAVAGSLTADQLQAVLNSYAHASNTTAPPTNLDSVRNYDFFAYYYNAANSLASPSLSPSDRVKNANNYVAGLLRYFPIVNGAITFRA